MRGRGPPLGLGAGHSGACSWRVPEAAHWSGCLSLSCIKEYTSHIYTLSRRLPNRQAYDSPCVASFNSVARAVDRESLSTLPPAPGRGLARP